MPLPLQTMAGDEMAGATGDQLGGDSLAILAGVDGFKGKLQELPASYAQAVENEVVWVALNSSSVSSDQLNTAATNAQDLASQIDKLCLSSP